MSMKELVMTRAGLEALEKELEELKTVRRKDVAEKIKVARGFGDLSENSEYDEAKNEQGFIESRIAQLEAMLKHARVIDNDDLSLDHVSVGTHVKIEDEDGEVEEYDITGSTEAEFWAIIDKFYNRDIFYKDEYGRWMLKEPIWEEK